MFESPFAFSILKKAQEKSLIQIHLIDPRDYTTDRHHTTDDDPYGGGQGMVMKPEPLVAAIDSARAQSRQARVILLTPRGRLFTQPDAQRLAQEKELVLVCGRYEGIDERVTAFVDEEISVGDYTLSGGEPAATVLIDTVARLIPGVLGNENSPLDESFVDGLTRISAVHPARRVSRHESARGSTFRRPRARAAMAPGTESPNHARRAARICCAMQRQEQRTWTSTCTLRAPVYVALLHHPVYDKNDQVVTTAVTNMDIHDIARSGCTYGGPRLLCGHAGQGIAKARAQDHRPLGERIRQPIQRYPQRGACPGADLRQLRTTRSSPSSGKPAKNPPSSARRPAAARAPLSKRCETCYTITLVPF